MQHPIGGIKIMQQLLDRYEKHYGYKATPQELWTLYSQGELQLNDTDTNTLIKEMEG